MWGLIPYRVIGSQECSLLLRVNAVLIATEWLASLLSLLLLVSLCRPLHGDSIHAETLQQVFQTALCIQVLARSSPTDKFNLVKLLKKQGEIVAVTGMPFCWWTCNICR